MHIIYKNGRAPSIFHYFYTRNHLLLSAGSSTTKFDIFQIIYGLIISSHDEKEIHVSYQKTVEIVDFSSAIGYHY